MDTSLFNGLVDTYGYTLNKTINETWSTIVKDDNFLRSDGELLEQQLEDKRIFTFRYKGIDRAILTVEYMEIGISYTVKFFENKKETDMNFLNNDLNEINKLKTENERLTKENLKLRAKMDFLETINELYNGELKKREADFQKLLEVRSGIDGAVTRIKLSPDIDTPSEKLKSLAIALLNDSKRRYKD